MKETREAYTIVDHGLGSGTIFRPEASGQTAILLGSGLIDCIRMRAVKEAHLMFAPTDAISSRHVGNLVTPLLLGNIAKWILPAGQRGDLMISDT